ncbi:beta-class carbonic anhydrase [Propionibacteriaceae bacterium Y2011]|uniref:beta-class carbonic anhydrase n=1 Tax=Microlunatus sp. Y2014 TaxID=3418488 RepID=UPI003B49E760
MPEPDEAHPFADLLAANEQYAATFTGGEHFDGLAHAGLGLLTCMDSRIEPLGMVGLHIGDAKILRTPGGRLTEESLNGLILAVSLLGVSRIMLVPHTRCAMAGGAEAIRAKAMEHSGIDLGGLSVAAFTDQLAGVRYDVARLRNEPLINSRAVVGGFLYDVDTGRLESVA